MLALVCYDVGDVQGAGATRLRHISNACLDFGTRVQYSVFECRLTAAQWVVLKDRLLGLFDPAKDSLRFYLLCERDEQQAEHHGVTKGLDPTGPLVL